MASAMDTLDMSEKALYDMAEHDLLDVWHDDLLPASSDPVLSSGLASTLCWPSSSELIRDDRLLTDGLMAESKPRSTSSSCSSSCSGIRNESDNESMPDSPISFDQDTTYASSELNCESLLKPELKLEPLSPRLDASSCPSPSSSSGSEAIDYSLVLNSNSKLVHLPSGNSRSLLKVAKPIVVSKNIGQSSLLVPSVSLGNNSNNYGSNSNGLSNKMRNKGSRNSYSSGRHPISTPLISSQPVRNDFGKIKGTTGPLLLTEEEKRTLLSEGFSVPQRLPLTKQEEKSLKKIRRKIKNKISAQESRRKKKEYMDCLERKMDSLHDELLDYRSRCQSLESENSELKQRLKTLQQQLNQ